MLPVVFFQYHTWRFEIIPLARWALRRESHKGDAAVPSKICQDQVDWEPFLVELTPINLNLDKG